MERTGNIHIFPCLYLRTLLSIEKNGYPRSAAKRGGSSIILIGRKKEIFNLLV
jgi:hypothetical protein